MSLGTSIGSHAVGGTSMSVSRVFAETIEFTGDTPKANAPPNIGWLPIITLLCVKCLIA